MKKYKIILLIFSLLVFTSCSSNERTGNVVKSLVIQEDLGVYKAIFICYDYSEKEIAYKFVENEAYNINNAVIGLLNKDNFDLKLCEYLILQDSIAEEKLNEVFSVVNSAKFSQGLNLICIKTNKALEKIFISENIENPLCDFIFKDQKVTAQIPMLDGVNYNEINRILIIDNKMYKKLNMQECIVLDMLVQKSKQAKYKFYLDEKEMMANISDIKVVFSDDNAQMTVNIFAQLNSYHGLEAGQKGRKKFIDLFKKELSKTVLSIYNDKVIKDVYHLDWYKKMNNLKSEDIAINIEIK